MSDPRLPGVYAIPTLRCHTCGQHVLILDTKPDSNGHYRIEYPCDSCKHYPAKVALPQLYPIIDDRRRMQRRKP